MSIKTFEQIKTLVQSDYQKCEQLITKCLESDVPLVKEVASHLIHAGGKRIRPILSILSAKAMNYEGDDHIKLGVIIEVIHSATLLHDDVVDDSSMRRGKQTANQTWNNPISVLTGDFLYSRAFQLMVEVNNIEVMAHLSNATNRLAEGEIRQLLHKNKTNVTESEYLYVIQNKTAKLFESATYLSTVISKQAKLSDAMASYGLNLGTAFQLIDDIMDLNISSAVMGKNRGDDLADGKASLPLIYAMEHASKADQAAIKDTIVHGRQDNVSAISQIVEQCGAIEYTFQLAQHYANLAKTSLHGLPDSKYGDAMATLCDIATTRTA